MRVYLGSDHAGFELKNHLVEWLAAAGHQPVDCGPHWYDADDDYPPFCLRAAERTAADPGSLGVVVGGSGNGEQIAANKVKGVRAVLAWSEETAALGREHNDANVISVGGRMHTTEEATKFVEVFLGTSYSGAKRHTRRIDMLTAYEETGELPPLPDEAEQPEQPAAQPDRAEQPTQPKQAEEAEQPARRQHGR
jgi:ribose 5-phosphate isomerase B